MMCSTDLIECSGKSAVTLGTLAAPLAGREVSKIPRGAASGKVNVDKSQDRVRNAIYGPLMGQNRAPMDPQNNIHFSIRNHEAPRYFLIVTQMDSVNFAAIGFAFKCLFHWDWILVHQIMSFVRRFRIQDRPIVSGLKSSF